MRLETYRRKDKAHYAELQAYLDEVGEEAGVEVPSIYDILQKETAQIERLSFLAARKMRFEDQFNHQEVTADITNDTPVVLGAKSILGQVRRVYLNTSFQGGLNPRMFDWQPVGEQQFEVIVRFQFDPIEPVGCTFDVWGN